jgi:antitoxin ParD1/3/4
MLQTVQSWCKFTSKINVMARQSISFTKPNDEWLKAQVNSQEYSSKSELVNDLIRQARRQQAQNEWIKEKLNKSEANGFTDETKEQILKQSKSSLNG